MIPDSLTINAVSGSSYNNGALSPVRRFFLTGKGRYRGEAVRNFRIINVSDVLQCEYYIRSIPETAAR